MVMDKRHYIDLFVALGQRLAEFGDNRHSSEAIESAVRDNPWFTRADIMTAVRAIRQGMLTEETLSKWLDRYAIDYSKPKNVAVIMAGNIPLVGFFDLMCVVICGCRCFYKTSSKDSVLIDYVVGLLKDICSSVSLEVYDDQGEYDAVIATGSDTTNLYFRNRFGTGKSLLRGTRHSLAVLSGHESEEQLRGLADDMFLYYGMGCRNVSLLFLPRGFKIDNVIQRAMHYKSAVNKKYINNYLQSNALLKLSGVGGHIDLGFFTMREERSFSNTISTINYAYYDSLSEVKDWIDDNNDLIQCVVSGYVDLLRGTKFGTTQYPRPWDYPDGIDVISFLIND